MRVVITGGCGFLGSAVASHLLDEGHDVVLFDYLPPGSKGIRIDTEYVQGEVRDQDAIAKVVRRADEVYHMAGVLGTAELQEDVHHAIEVNVIGAVNVFEAAVAAGVQRVFYPGKPNVWLNTYTITKECSENFARMYNRSGHDITISSLRYFNGFGPGQSLQPIRKIIPAFAVQAMRGLPIEVFGDGEQIVDMIYSGDIGALTVNFTRSGCVDRIPDCGSGIGLTVNQVAESVNAHFGNKAGIRHLPMRAGETPNTVLTADTTALREVLGDYPMTSYEDALALTLDWYAGLDSESVDKAVAFYGWGAS